MKQKVKHRRQKLLFTQRRGSVRWMNRKALRLLKCEKKVYDE